MMTFKEYITNPSGIKSSAISYRKMYEDLYQDKWGKIMTRENGHIEYKLYNGKGNIYYAYLKIPSETIDKFYYDIVIEFISNGVDRTLDNAQVKFFSNDPSFNYTFAHVFKKNNLTIKELENKMSKKALSKPPIEKNPYNMVGYVKTLFFAYLFLKDRGLLYKVRFTSEATSINWKTLIGLITDTDVKIESRIEAEEKLNKEKKKTNNINKLTKDDIKNPEIHANRSINIKKVGLLSHSNKSKGIKKSKRI